MAKEDLKDFVKLEDLEIYRLSLELSEIVWEIYKNLERDIKWTIGKQFLESIDSIGANIAEGYGRFHYLDSIKFYYNARGSLWESKHWLTLMLKRKIVSQENYDTIASKLEKLGIKLNNFITSVKKKTGNK